MASVTYKIGGKYDGKALKSAKKDFSDLATIVKGFAVVKVAQQLNKVAQATKSVFSEQNKALVSFNTAVHNSGLELDKLNNIKKELSHGNFIDDDSLNNAMKLGMQMGLNADQLERVTRTAVNMASAGVKPLDKAMKELSKTALSNSNEFDALVSRYDGFADAMSKTFSGRDAQWKNSLSDLQASIGAIPKSLEFITQGKLLEPLNKITEWMVTNRNKIINFFLHLPEVFTVIGKSFIDMMKRTFENFPSLITNVGVYFVQIFKDGFLTIFNVAKESFMGMMTLLDFAIGNPFRSSKNFINTMLNNLIEGINALPQKLPNWTKALFGIDEKTEPIKFRFATGQNDSNKTWKETAQKIEKSMSNVINAYKDGAKRTKDDWIKVLNATTQFYSEDISTLKEKLGEILGKDLPEELQSALDGITYNPSTDGSGVVTGESEEKKKSGLATVGSSALGGLGEVGSIVSSVLQNGIWGAIAELLTKIFARISEVSPIFQWFQEIFSNILDVLINPESGLIGAIEKFLQPFLDGFNAVKDILSGVLSVVASIFNVFTPILQGFTMILNKVAPIVMAIFEVVSLLLNFIGVIGNMLNPVLDAILTVVSPVLEFIYKIIRFIYSILASIVNVVIAIYNKIAWRDIDYIDTEMKSASSTDYGNYTTFSPDLSGYATASATSTSGNASYQSAKDIYVNINFANSYVNGDAREIALMLRDEIRNAERLGY